MGDRSTFNRDNFVRRISSLTPKSYVLSPTSAAPMLEISANSINTAQIGTADVPESSTIQSQYVHPHANSRPESSTASSSTYTFLQIKREPCQVSEITTSNHHQQNQSTRETLVTDSSATSTLTTVVKIESSSPKNQNGLCDVSGGIASTSMSTMEKSMNKIVNT